jgi:hypothetical protein
MPVPLSIFGRPFLITPEQRHKLVDPVLVWESPSGAPAKLRDEVTFVINLAAGAPPPLPRSGEPLVFEVKKGAAMNAFGLGITVGRTDNNDIAVADASVSRFQGYFQLNPRTGTWTFTDAGSTNGTFLNGKRVAPSRPEPLGACAAISFGHVSMRFFVPSEFFHYLDDVAKR